MIALAAILYCYVPTVPTAPTCGLTLRQCQEHIYYASRGTCRKEAK
jgi:hypothetical protein